MGVMSIHLRLITFHTMARHTMAWTCTQRPLKGTRMGKGEITRDRWTNRSNTIGDKGVSRNGPRSRRIGSGNGSRNVCAIRAREGDTLQRHTVSLALTALHGAGTSLIVC